MSAESRMSADAGMSVEDQVAGSVRAEHTLELVDSAARHRIQRDTGRSLFVEAGAGSGKTNTLAHRVAHLILSGADPRRILLMTFSRRAAAV